MKRLVTFIAVVGFGWLGWIAGEKIGYVTAYFASGIASMLGIYVSWKLLRRLED